MLDRRRSERVDSTLEDVEVDQEIARRMGLRSGLFVPLLVGDRAIGVIAAHNRMGADPRFKDLRIGSHLLRDVVFERAKTLASDFGCVGILVDAKNGVSAFYARFGFVPLEELVGASSTPMFLPMPTLLSASAR